MQSKNIRYLKITPRSPWNRTRAIKGKAAWGNSKRLFITEISKRNGGFSGEKIYRQARNRIDSAAAGCQYFSFLILQAAPGSPIDNYMQPGMTEEQIEALKEEYGLNGSIAEQYWYWLKHVLQGDMGTSISKNRSVTELIAEHLPATVSLMGASLLISIVCSIPLGLIAGLHKDRPVDKVISTITYFGISIPPFWIAMISVIIFAIKLRWFPTGGMHSLDVESTADTLWHMVLPACVLSLNHTAVYTKYIRSNTISQLEEDYVVTAVSKGTNKNIILFRHVLKNCLLPIITLIGMNIARLVCGSFIIENIFSWPGIGRLCMEAVGGRDYPVIMGYTMFSCLILIVGNLVADVLYAVADPRIREGMGRK